jgi:hypothetical protein
MSLAGAHHLIFGDESPKTTEQWTIMDGMEEVSGVRIIYSWPARTGVASPPELREKHAIEFLGGQKTYKKRLRRALAKREMKERRGKQ